MPAAPEPRLQPQPRPRPRGSGLRAVPGGYDIDRLPIAVPRHDCEILESWLHRTAYTYGLHPRAMLAELGLAPTQGLLWVRELLVGRDALEAATRLGLTLNALTTRSPVIEALRLTRTRWRTEFRKMQLTDRPRGTRWCPHCLAETGYWQEIWADPLVVYCPEHHVALAAMCPTCRTVPYSTTGWAASLLDQLICPALVPGGDRQGRFRGRCGTRLDQVHVAEATDAQISDQQWLLDLIGQAADNPSALVRVCGIEAHAQVVVEAVYEMIEQAIGATTVPIPANQTDVITEAIHNVAEALHERTLRGAYRSARATSLVWKPDALEIVGPKSTARWYARNPLITAMWLDDLRGTLPPDIEFKFRMGSPRPRYPDRWQTHDRVLQPIDARPGLPLAWIPQLAWAGALDLPDIGELGLDTVRGRALISMCLAKYGTTRGWREIATALGLPVWVAAQLQRGLNKITHAGRRDAFVQALDALFHRIHDTPPPIDYERRRTLLWDGEIFKADTTIGRIRAAQRIPLPFTEIRRLFWTLYTGGAEVLAPPAYKPVTTPGPSGATEIPNDHALIGVEPLLPPHLQDGPLTWTPP